MPLTPLLSSEVLRPFALRRHMPIAALAGLMSCLLIACGGGGGSASLAPVASTVATTTGTVNGFASVIVDGKEIEDATATTQTENADGSYTNVSLKLGQRVEVTQQASLGTATSVTTSITAHAAVVGTVSNLTASAGEFKAAGQWVKVNADTAAGPVTVFGGGYAAIASMATGDLVEVHGSATYSATKAAYVIQATRIDKQASISAVRISGKVASLDTAAKSFAINGVTVKYATATLVPNGSTLANGQTVLVWGPPGSFTGGIAPVLTATRLRINTAATAPTAGTGQVGGLVSNYSAAAKTFAIDGVSINAASATVTPTGASVANGGYVDVTGIFGSTGVLSASAIRVRQQDTSNALANIRLSGAISAFVSTTSFVVRGLPVDASAIVLATACPGVTLANGVVVDINATQQVGTDVLKASSMRCQPSTTVVRYTMQTQSGKAGTVDAAAKTFVLTRSTGSQKVQWSDQTAWGAGVSASSLGTATTTLVVEGYPDSSSVLVARSVRVLGTADVDRYSPDRSALSCSSSTTSTLPSAPYCATASEGWDAYDANFRSGKK